MVKAENFLLVLRAPPSRGAHSLCILQKTSPMGNEFLGRKAEKGDGRPARAGGAPVGAPVQVFGDAACLRAGEGLALCCLSSICLG